MVSNLLRPLTEAEVRYLAALLVGVRKMGCTPAPRVVDRVLRRYINHGEMRRRLFKQGVLVKREGSFRVHPALVQEFCDG